MTTLAASPSTQMFQQPSRGTLILRYLRRNKSLTIGLAILLFLTLFTVVGYATVPVTKLAYPLSVKPKQPPDPLCIFDAKKTIGK